MGYRRKGKRRNALSRRYGRAWSSESAITKPRRDGSVDVILVDSRGTPTGTLARGVPLSLARTIIKRRHG